MLWRREVINRVSLHFHTKREIEDESLWECFKGQKSEIKQSRSLLLRKQILSQAQNDVLSVFGMMGREDLNSVSRDEYERSTLLPTNTLYARVGLMGGALWVMGDV